MATHIMLIMRSNQSTAYTYIQVFPVNTDMAYRATGTSAFIHAVDLPCSRVKDESWYIKNNLKLA